MKMHLKSKSKPVTFLESKCYNWVLESHLQKVLNNTTSTIYHNLLLYVHILLSETNKSTCSELKGNDVLKSYHESAGYLSDRYQQSKNSAGTFLVQLHSLSKPNPIRLREFVPSAQSLFKL